MAKPPKLRNDIQGEKLMRSNRAFLPACVAVATLTLVPASATVAEARPCLIRSMLGKGLGQSMALPGAGYGKSMSRGYARNMGSSGNGRSSSQPKSAAKPDRTYVAKPKPPVALAASSYAAATSAAKPAPATASAQSSAGVTCLTKEYLDTGAVKFRDTCTGEWAINATHIAKPATAPGAAGNCFKKDLHKQGIVLFRDVCTNEWAMNTDAGTSQGL